MVICLKGPYKVDGDIQKGDARERGSKHLTGGSRVRSLGPLTRCACLNKTTDVLSHVWPKKITPQLNDGFFVPKVSETVMGLFDERGLYVTTGRNN
jgi:hypothetical protein